MITVGSINQSDLHEHEDIIASSISYPRFHYLYCHLSDEASIPLVRCTQLTSNVEHLKVVGAIPYLDELNSQIPDDAVVFSGAFSEIRAELNFFINGDQFFFFSRKTETRYRPNSFCIVKFTKFVLH